MCHSSNNSQQTFIEYFVKYHIADITVIPLPVFTITDAKSGDKVGDISKLWAGPMEKERGLDNYDRFGIDFPDDAPLNLKAVLVSSCFLIDYLYFEGDDDDD